MNELKPCYKCGSENVTVISPMPAIYHVCCLNCETLGISGYYKRDAIAAWNKRTEGK